MPTLTIRNIEPALKERLRVRAARNGRSMEAELRHILSTTIGGGDQSRDQPGRSYSPPLPAVGWRRA
jgi:antitoxin FitA